MTKQHCSKAKKLKGLNNLILHSTFFSTGVVNLQPGTYLYHAHYGMQREAGLYGSIRVLLNEGESEPFQYDYDRSIILNDWYHKSTHELSLGLSSIPFAWVNEPQVIISLINLINTTKHFKSRLMDNYFFF